MLAQFGESFPPEVERDSNSGWCVRVSLVFGAVSVCVWHREFESSSSFIFSFSASFLAGRSANLPPKSRARQTDRQTDRQVRVRLFVFGRQTSARKEQQRGQRRPRERL